MKIFNLVKADFKKAQTYLHSFYAAAVGGVVGSVYDVLSNPHAIAHLALADVKALFSKAGAGALSGVFLFWVKSKSPSSVTPAAPQAPVDPPVSN